MVSLTRPHVNYAVSGPPHVIARREPYHELGADYLERRRTPETVDRLVERLRQLGVDVTVTTAPYSAPPLEDAALAATP